MTPDQMFRMLIAAKAQTDAMGELLTMLCLEFQGQVESRRPVPNETPDGVCPHPEEGRIPRKAMGHPNRFFCSECKQEIE